MLLYSLVMMKKSKKISGFFLGGEGGGGMDFHHLAKPKNVSVDSKCDVLCL